MLAERQHDQAAAILRIGRIRVERQKARARMLAQQERERGADGGVGETGQRFGGRHDVPDPADIGERNQERGFAFGAPQRRHEVRLVLVTTRRERRNEGVERFAGRAAQEPDEPRGVFLNERPQVRRMIGEAEKDIARPAAFEFGLELRGRRSLQQRSQAPARFGRRGKPRRLGKALSERCGHSGPSRRRPPIEADPPPPAR